MNAKPQAKRRFTEHKKNGKPLVLPSTHKAFQDGRTLFPGRVMEPNDLVALFKSGEHSRKIGSHVTKGMWKGLPIYTLTLEERATCPSACAHWGDCYGNKMHWSTRWKTGLGLQSAIFKNLEVLTKKHPAGLVIRLHVLGDFYSAAYVQFWGHIMGQFPTVRVFGYTARDGNSAIGGAIDWLNIKFSTRWRVRWSDKGGRMGTTTTKDVTSRGNVAAGIVCPAQTGDSSCCGTCGLCWNTDKPIVFIEH